MLPCQIGHSQIGHSRIGSSQIGSGQIGSGTADGGVDRVRIRPPDEATAHEGGGAEGAVAETEDLVQRDAPIRRLLADAQSQTFLHRHDQRLASVGLARFAAAQPHVDGGGGVVAEIPIERDYAVHLGPGEVQRLGQQHRRLRLYPASFGLEVVEDRQQRASVIPMALDRSRQHRRKGFGEGVVAGAQSFPSGRDHDDDGAMESVTSRELNRWTLARQLLLARVPLDATAGVTALAGMQAQYSPSPYIGLWSRLTGFRREDLAEALAADRVVKTTVMRGTLHLVPTARLAHYRLGGGSAYYDDALRRLVAVGSDLGGIRAAVRAAVAAAHAGGTPLSREEVGALVVANLSGEVPAWVAERPTAVGSVSVATDLVNVAEDAAFGVFGVSRYRLAPPVAPVTPEEAFRQIILDYFGAFGPATAADLSQWSGRQVRDFSATLAGLEASGDLVRFRSDDGRTLLDLADAPRPPGDVVAPVRFLPKWDNVLLAYARRERIISDEHRKIVIRKNGDVLPTFLVDGTVAGTWDAPLRDKAVLGGKAVLTLTPLVTLAAKQRKEVEAEAGVLLGWLHPDAPTQAVRWIP